MDQVSLSLLATPVLRDLYHQIMMELAKRENGWNNTLPHIFSPSPQATTLPVFVSVPPPSQPMQAPAPVVETPPPPQAPVNVTVPGVETRPLPKTGYRQRNATTKVPASKVVRKQHPIETTIRVGGLRTKHDSNTKGDLPLYEELRRQLMNDMGADLRSISIFVPEGGGYAYIVFKSQKLAYRAIETLKSAGYPDVNEHVEEAEN